VVILGHVDHGKTKLLDTIRKTNVIDKESGGITQHIGAYQTEVRGKLITFLDTPGHEAFSAIRSRGVKVADVAVLVIAADESVKPQTKEAIKIIKEEEIPFVVAINKIDRPEANSQRVKQDLAAEDVLVEDWGGKVPCVEISARDNRNIDELLDMILLVAEVEELKDDRSLPAEGVIIESSLDKRRGYVATALVRKGVLAVGDWIVVGTVVGKIKSMEDFFGRSIMQAIPSQPVRITGWSIAPEIGKGFKTATSKDSATHIAEDNINLSHLFLFLKTSGEEKKDGKKIFNIVFKSDVSSSMEAIDNIIKAIKSDEIEHNVISYDIGNITERDVKTAFAGHAQVIGFRVGIEESAKKLAEKEGIKIATFDVIYHLVEYIRSEMGGLLAPEVKRNFLGKLRILAIFKKDTKYQIIGGKVTSGKVVRGAKAEIIKNGNIISGRVGQLQQNKQDVTEVSEGLEAGIRFDLEAKGDVKIDEGDVIEIFEEEEAKRML